MQQIVRDVRELFRQATRDSNSGCFTVSRPVSNLSASCRDVEASLWPAVVAAAYSPQPRLPQGEGSARDGGASHPSRHDQLTGSTFYGAWYSWQRPLHRRYNDLKVCDIGLCVFNSRGSLGAILSLGGDPEVSLDCDDILLIGIVVGLDFERVPIASWSRSICHPGRWPRGVVAVLLQGTCEVDSDFTHGKLSVLIDVTIRSVGLTFG